MVGGKGISDFFLSQFLLVHTGGRELNENGPMFSSVQLFVFKASLASKHMYIDVFYGLFRLDCMNFIFH